MRYFNMAFVRQQPWYATGLTFIALFYCSLIQAQTADGNNGINQANTVVRSYYEAAVNLVFAIAGICALMGALRVYQKINGHGTGQGNTNGEIAAWFGGCVFLVVVTTVIKAFFGL